MERQNASEHFKIAVHKIRIGPRLHNVPSSVSGFSEKRRGFGIMADKGLVLSFVLVGRPYKSI